MKHGALALAGLLAACGGAPEQREAPPATESASPDRAAPVPALGNAPLALGSWTFREMDGEAAALFGPPASEATFLIRCDARLDRVHFIRAGALASSESTMTIVAGDASETLPARAAATQMRQIEAVLPADAAFIVEVLARNPERLGVAIGDGSMRVMPGDPAIARALQGCVRR